MNRDQEILSYCLTRQQLQKAELPLASFLEYLAAIRQAALRDFETSLALHEATEGQLRIDGLR
jgi:hypothetical protein